MEMYTIVLGGGGWGGGGINTELGAIKPPNDFFENKPKKPAIPMSLGYSHVMTGAC